MSKWGYAPTRRENKKTKIRKRKRKMNKIY